MAVSLLESAQQEMKPLSALETAQQEMESWSEVDLSALETAEQKMESGLWWLSLLWRLLMEERQLPMIECNLPTCSAGAGGEMVCGWR